MLTSLTLGRINFNVVQLLWINLIMDTFGAIAICTEPYQKQRLLDAKNNGQQIKTARVKKNSSVLQPYIWRNVLTQVLYQSLVILILAYFGVFMFFDETFNLIAA